MPKALDLVGKRFGNLVVLNKCDHKSNSGKVLWYANVIVVVLLKQQQET